MPPGVSIPLAVAFHGLFDLGFGALGGVPGWTAPAFGAFLFGYLAYDLLHYATHHLPMPGAVGRWLKRHHLLHHHASPDARFGVSSALWDVVFRTLPGSSGVSPDAGARAG
jgi:sterol desaturase/sphingolipid hydroxylase (fatty acid hydroxylase superfamily)